MAGTTDPPDGSRDGSSRSERLLAIDEPQPAFTPAPVAKIMPPMSFTTGEVGRPAFPHEADAAPLPILRFHSITHPGLVHPRNEDSHAIMTLDDGSVLLLVCDGMGGMGRGDQASQLAIRELGQAFVKATGTVQERIATAIVQADRVIREKLCAGGDGWAGSTAVLVHVDKPIATVGWVGDSRAYHVRNGNILSRTKDHKLVQELVDAGQLTADEARRSALGSVITKSLGGRPPTMPPTQPSVLEPWKLEIGDRVLLCSDGLSDLVSDPELPRLLKDRSLVVVGDQLVGTALSRGGHDNITIVVMACDDPEETLSADPEPPMTRPELDPDGPRLGWWIWGVILAIGLVLFGAFHFLF